MSTITWTCGECGDSYSADGPVGDFVVDRWARDHKENHRLEKLPPEERRAILRLRSDALMKSITERLP